DDYNSSEEYLPPGNESESEYSDGNSVENGVDLENSEWNFDINTEPEFVDFTGIPGLRCNVPNSEPFIVGTLRKNRKDNPKEILNSKLKNGEVIKWRDTRDVSMISSKHKLDFENVVDKFGRSKFKPNMVVDYNTKMSGIDKVAK
ncbi:Uncharacterized protein FWK35_00020098, partial [Aphis craccivora]